jgi:glucodextranase-like protein/PASTA domain-containing protein
VRRLVLLLVVGLALGACGETPRPATEPRVKLKLEAPDDGGSILADRVAVRGTVTPGDAAVQVAGEDAEVSDGAFTAEVDLQPGGNVIDVTASSPGRRPATDALRVMRDMRVPVPKLVGRTPEDADTALRSAGLTSVEERGGSWIDRLLPGGIQVCATRPRAGALVEKGTRVTLETARDCAP